MAEIIFTEGAEQDYTDSLNWYAVRSERAARSFEAEIAGGVEAITDNCDCYPFCDDRHRSYLLKRYPFQIIYRELSSDRILIVAAAHASRRPGYWSDR